jgi:hypothetical protein
MESGLAIVLIAGIPPLIARPSIPATQPVLPRGGVLFNKKNRNEEIRKEAIGAKC